MNQMTISMVAQNRLLTKLLLLVVLSSLHPNSMQSKIPSVPFEPLIFLSGLQLFAVKSLFVFNSVCMSIIFVCIHTFCIYIQIHILNYICLKEKM